MTVEYIRERQVFGRRLGRHLEHDPQSLRFAVKPRASVARTVLWDHKIPVLDQGDLGSCTGNATVAALGSLPYWSTVQDRPLDEDQAIALYSAATRLDPFPGEYEPTDTGSSGLAVAKAAKVAGLISGYVHATSLDATVTALQSGPVITGVNWYEGFDRPDSAGRVTVRGQVRGGHEFCLLGVDVEKRELRAVNSWGEGYGQGGQFTIPFADFDRLLSEDGDVTAFVPLTMPAPTPKLPDDVDAALIAGLEPWAASITSRFGKAGRAKAAYVAWRASRGY
jgi:C1A family cysteine protease